MPDIHLDLIDRIEIATPCSARWEDMVGDAKTRHCADCDLNVHNLSAMTRGEVTSLIESVDGRICGRIFRRADGTVLTQDCPVGLARVAQASSRIAKRAIAGVALVIIGVVSIAASRDHAVLTASLSEREPFGRLREWLNPSPFPGGGQMILGSICLPTPVPTPQPAPDVLPGESP